MKLYPLTEVEGARADGTILKALRALVRALNDLASRSSAGDARLSGGTALVTIPALQAGTRVVVGYARPTGTTGTLSCDPAEFDISRKTAVLRSSSSADVNAVTWVALT